MLNKIKNTVLYKKFYTGLCIVLACYMAENSFAQALEEIIVTAQKREQSLQDVPITVTALSGETLDEFGIDDLFEVANLVPGMIFSRAPDDGLALTLRGLGTPARTQSFDQSVALFLDGMFVGKGRMYSASFFDVERMEVIKGTQSTLLGKNTSLGAISIVTNKPGEENGGFAEASVELENGGWGFDGAYDFRISNELGIRVAGHYVEQSGWVRNLSTGRDTPDDEDLGIRATMVYEPTDTLSITASYQYTDSERQGNGFQFVDKGGWITADGIALLGEVGLDDQRTALCIECPGDESFHDTEVNSFNMTVEYDAANYSITSVTSYADYNLKFFDDFDFGDAFDEVTYLIGAPLTPDPAGTVNPYSTYFERDEEYDQFSQELRLASSTSGSLEYLAGLFYFTSDWISSEQQNWSTPNFPPGAPINLFLGPFTNNFTQDTETISAFGQLTYNFSDRLRGAFGLRYTDEKKDVVFERVVPAPVPIWTTDLNPAFDSPLSFDDSFLNGNANIQFDLTPEVMIYAGYGIGNKTGGFAESAEVRSANPALDVADNGARVKTEEAETFEFGAKMVLLGGAANLNFAYYMTDIKDFQETSFQVSGMDALFLTRNIDVDSEGFEMDGQWQATDGLRLIGGVTYADTINAGDKTTLAQAPLWTGSIGFNYEQDMSSMDLAFKLGGFLRYRDEMVSQINETFPSDDLTTLDLTLGLYTPDNKWALTLVGQNITNELSADFSGPPAAPIGAIFGAPPGDQGIAIEAPSQLRTIKLQLRYHF